MSLASIVGGVLFDSEDLDAAAQALAVLLIQEAPDSDRVRAAGLDPVLVLALRRRLPSDPISIVAACAAGAAWVEGRRSVGRRPKAELVASYPASVPLPTGVVRTTGETLLSIIAQTDSILRLTAPFITPPGLEIVADALVVAVRRGVKVQVICEPPVGDVARAWRKLRERLEAESGTPGSLALQSPPQYLAWPHLKVVTSDGLRAYVGSANFTRPGLTGQNIELGVLITGEIVRAIDNLLDQLIALSPES